MTGADRSVYVLGVDPGFARAGFAIARVLPSSHPKPFELVELGLISTDKSDRKRHVLACDDDFRRSTELAGRVRALAEARRVVLVAAEAKSHPRNASSAAKVAIFWGVLAAVVERGEIPCAQTSPQDVRRALGLAKGAAKEEVHRVLAERFSGLDALLGRLSKEDRKHPLDAAAAIAAAERSDLFRAIRAAA